MAQELAQNRELSDLPGLPDEILLKIFQKLNDIKDVIQIGSSNSRFYSITHDISVTKKFFQADMQDTTAEALGIMYGLRVDCIKVLGKYAEKLFADGRTPENYKGFDGAAIQAFVQYAEKLFADGRTPENYKGFNGYEIEAFGEYAEKLFADKRTPENYKGFDSFAIEAFGKYAEKLFADKRTLENYKGFNGYEIEAFVQYAEKLFADGRTPKDYLEAGSILKYCLGFKELPPHLDDDVVLDANVPLIGVED
ncbi:MAG: hypothetical protein RLZZ59_147 [Pseudomonadota bacterium]